MRGGATVAPEPQVADWCHEAEISAFSHILKLYVVI